MHQIGPIGECAHERNREPVADRLTDAGLIFHVVREVRKRVPLRIAAIIGNRFIAAGEGNRLEAQERNFLRIGQRETNHRAHLFVVHAVDQGDDRHDIDAIGVQIFDGAKFHIEQIAHRAMRVGFVADAVELQIGVAQTGFGGLLAKLGALGEFDAVGSRLHAVVADFPGIADGVQEIRRKRRLAAGKLYRHLAPRLDGNRVVEQRLNVFPRQFVNEADLIGVHEARIAHHVAAVRKVDREHRTAAMFNGRSPVVMELFVVVGRDVAARENVLKVFEERRNRWPSNLRSGHASGTLSPSGSCRRVR